MPSTQKPFDPFGVFDDLLDNSGNFSNFRFSQKQLAFLLATAYWYKQEFAQLSIEKQREFKTLTTRGGIQKTLTEVETDQLTQHLERDLVQIAAHKCGHDRTIYELADLKALLGVDEGLQRSIAVVIEVADLEPEATCENVTFPSFQRDNEKGWCGLEVVNSHELRLWGGRALPGIETTIARFIADKDYPAFWKAIAMLDGKDYDPDCPVQRGILEMAAGDIFKDQLLGALATSCGTTDPVCHWAARISTHCCEPNPYNNQGLKGVVLKRQRNQ